MNIGLDPKETPGQIIKATREAKQISLDEVAQKLLLSKEMIIAIEKDDYSRIPAPVYAEGYIKAYAQMLQIPADSLLMSFRKLNIYIDNEGKPTEEEQSKVSLLKADLWQDRRVRSVLFSIILLGSVLILLAVFSGNLKLPGKRQKDMEGSNMASAMINGGKGITEESRVESIPVVTISVDDE